MPALPWQAGGPVERIFVDAAEPRVALAALGGEKGPHVLRTTNSGNFWDPLDGNLPDAPAHGVTAERAAGAVYVATDKGVFLARVDLENASRPDSVAWVNLSDRLPAAAATDVRLDPAGVQLYAALDGHGVYAAAAVVPAGCVLSARMVLSNGVTVASVNGPLATRLVGQGLVHESAVIDELLNIAGGRHATEQFDVLHRLVAPRVARSRGNVAERA